MNQINFVIVIRKGLIFFDQTKSFFQRTWVFLSRRVFGRILVWLIVHEHMIITKSMRESIKMIVRGWRKLNWRSTFSVRKLSWKNISCFRFCEVIFLGYDFYLREIKVDGRFFDLL